MKELAVIPNRQTLRATRASLRPSMTLRLSDGIKALRTKKRAVRTEQMESARQSSPSDKVKVRTEDGEILGTADVGSGGTLRFAVSVNATAGGLVYPERIR